MLASARFVFHLNRKYPIFALYFRKNKRHCIIFMIQLDGKIILFTLFDDQSFKVMLNPLLPLRVRRLFYLALAFLLPLTACQSDSSNKRVEEIRVGGTVADIIRNPVSANQPLDTVNVARIVFEENNFDFGEVEEGTVVTHTYRFTNTGKIPLLISGASSTCGCTVPEYPKTPVPPGESGVITVKFNTEGKTERQSKPITIMANTYPSETKIFLNGIVKPGK
jgi:hypothetical protein